MSLQSPPETAAKVHARIALILLTTAVCRGRSNRLASA